MSSEVFLPFLLFSMTFKKCYFPLFFLLSFLNLPQAREAVRVSWCRKCLLWRGPNKCEFVLSLNLSVRMQYLPLLLHLVLALVLASLPPHSPLCFFFFYLVLVLVLSPHPPPSSGGDSSVLWSHFLFSVSFSLLFQVEHRRHTRRKYLDVCVKLMFYTACLLNHKFNTLLQCFTWYLRGNVSIVCVTFGLI